MPVTRNVSHAHLHQFHGDNILLFTWKGVCDFYMYTLSINITTSVHLSIVWGEIWSKVDRILCVSFFRNVSHALNFHPHIEHSRPKDILSMSLEYNYKGLGYQTDKLKDECW